MRIENLFRKNNKEEVDEVKKEEVSDEKARLIKINNCDSELIVALTEEFNQIMIGSKEEIMDNFYQASMRWLNILNGVDKTTYYIILELVARYFLFVIKDKKEKVLELLDRISLVYADAIIYVLELEVGKIEVQDPIVRKAKKYYAKILITRYFQKMAKEELVRKRAQS